VHLIDLALASKQAHWNLQGPQFQSIHEQLDLVVDDVREYADEVAERITTRDVAADGRSHTVAGKSSLTTFPEGRPRALGAAAEIAERLEDTSKLLREHQQVLSEVDPISEDLVIEVLRSLEKHRWMLNSIVAHERG
jgi:starvation-inducible DNA-binding protein